MVFLLLGLTFDSVTVGEVDSKYTLWSLAYVLAYRDEYIVTGSQPQLSHTSSPLATAGKGLFIDGEASQMVPKPVPSSHPNHSDSYLHVHREVE